MQEAPIITNKDLEDIKKLGKICFACTSGEAFTFSPEEKEFLAKIPDILPLKKWWFEVFDSITSSNNKLVSFELKNETLEKAFNFFESSFKEIFDPVFQPKLFLVASKHLENGIYPVVLMSFCENLKVFIIKELKEKGFNDSYLCLISRFFSLLATYFFQAFYSLLFENLFKTVEQLTRKNRFLTLIREINFLIFPENLSEKELFENACHILVRDGGYGLAWIGLIENKKIELKGAFPQNHPYLKLLPRQMEEFMGSDLEEYARKFLSGHPVIINDVCQDKAYQIRADKIRPFGLNSIAIVPILEKEGVIGGLFVYHTEANYFRSDEINLLLEIGRDISLGLRHLRQRDRLEEALFRDELTGIPNEKAFIMELASLASKARKQKSSIALFRLDIIDFSEINHQVGYATGDKILKKLASRLKNFLNGRGFLARTGPDEFAIATTFNDLAALKSFVSSLREVLRKPFFVGDSHVRLEIGIGVALYPEHGEDILDVYEKASVALKKVFRQEKGGLAFYSPEHSPQILQKFHLLGEVERAIERKEFVLFYQPRIDLQNRKVSGFEALLRWKHPERGIVSPLEFIPVLEESGLILEVEPLIFQMAFAFLKKLEDNFPEIRVSVNVSAIQLKSEKFPQKLFQWLEEYVISKQALELEITESLLLEPQAVKNIKLFYENGFKLALDDFGTGYSSFRYLKDLKGIDIKIDRSFIAKVPDDRDQVSLVMAMVSMARGLNLRVIAEGIESREQLAFITGLGVDEVQGFYFSRPLPEQNALNFLQNYDPKEYFW
ncbi:diguanylate cyclase/phosphodiesterase with GAF sensor [Thermodesulfatator indicus DSM 15286]|uniref:Diguanylate cyclase/phosphodiesterase with GAF sensor n=1 Tax=Thermodesulfatator indicus (strain DSM 15286 / JCM 11887 / CIR29812) TaxID=667014 RepID=F8A8Q8_THEID|nr:GGDEF domain-containing protein [Thermodesulfatator indicus]AEH44846.1 diguanylate cyclase/phosphodiesterase with GAF sensor [Thermodesulfatator indicus DSM 15286]